MLDSFKFLNNFDLMNESPLFIGGTPAFSEFCTLNMYFDELRYYDLELKSFWIQAEAQGLNGEIEPNFIHLGCVNCRL